MTEALPSLVVVAGLGQLALAAVSLAIPRVLGWREETARLGPLTREVFWTYAAYIWGTNVAMGLLSCLAPDALLDGTPLARAVCGYVTTYWGARLVLQLAAFGRHAPPGRAFRLAEAALVALFSFLVLVYGAAVLASLAAP
ncbi:MAG: hypothetical protein KF878_15125 [Planctomycetes bacterium]|nr:hypothetical protein [Planctomycetota bacterium]